MPPDVSQIAERHTLAVDRALTREVNRLPSMYSRYLSQSLRSRLMSLAEQPDHERMRLDAEIDLARDTVLGEARLYDIAQEVHEKAYGTELEPDALLQRVMAGDRLRCALKSVADLIERVVHMRAAGKEALPIHAVNMLVMQVTKIAHDTLPEEFIPSFVNQLDAIRVSDELARGTSLTPDRDVIDMDATIPFVSPGTSQQDAESA